ncbi:MAG: hypothetical protein EXS16_03670 [Gemmataceae bacterium]|nr:hypothetical protein [Gemmataceae bacterium]
MLTGAGKRMYAPVSVFCRAGQRIQASQSAYASAGQFIVVEAIRWPLSRMVFRFRRFLMTLHPQESLRSSWGLAAIFLIVTRGMIGCQSRLRKKLRLAGIVFVPI